MWNTWQATRTFSQFGSCQKYQILSKYKMFKLKLWYLYFGFLIIKERGSVIKLSAVLMDRL